MPKIMVVNVTHSEESRVGILKDGTLEAFEIEALSREHLKGNIYKGLVRRIHPALEAAFVDIGAERDAFLPLDEICFRNLPHPPPPGGNGDARRGGRRRVRDLLRPGEEVVVQIAKEQFGSKPPTLTTFYSLPGRYLVLLPGSDEAGISRRIEGDERTRIRKLISDLNPPEGFGIIVRTAAGFDQDTRELERDFGVLQRLWENVTRVAATTRAPALVYREHDIVLRTIRDYFTPDIDEIYIDNEEIFERAREFLHDVMPGKEHVLRLYKDEQPIFSAFNVESQIEMIFKRRVPLRSGGTIVIDTAEALTAIDVNSGGSVRGPNPEETAFRTNLEAAREIARQLRLRDIGGIIVVDFIDMRDVQHIHEVERALRDAMRPDKARHELGRISRLGLLEISRQRLRPAAMATTYTSCPMCEGHGAIRTVESAALVALRKLHNRVAQGDVASLRVSLPSEVALYLLNQKRDDLAQLDERYSTRIQVNLSEKLMPHQMELEVRARAEKLQTGAKLAPGAVADAQPAAAGNGQSAETAGTQPAETGTGKRRRRRRGGRRGRARRAAVALGEALAALGAGTSLSPETEDVDVDNGGAENMDRGEAMTDDLDIATESAAATDESRAHIAPHQSDAASSVTPGRRRSRRRRGGGRRRSAASTAQATESGPAPASYANENAAATAPADPVSARHDRAADTAPPAKPRRRSSRGRRSHAKTADAAASAGGADTVAGAPTAARRQRSGKSGGTTARRRSSGTRRRKPAAPKPSAD